MKKHLSTILLISVLLIGLSLLLYPTVSDHWNALHQTRAIADYDAVLKNLQPETYTALFAAAHTYNQQLKEIPFPLMNYDQAEGYAEALDVTGSGLMGYITIPRIDVELPIYHGTSDGVLSSAVGHLEGTSLPIGGEDSHCVLSAHRGLPSAKLFTNLDQLEPGDTFSLSVLNQVLTYEVDQILIVEPTEVDALYIRDGEDCCTLITCTPYGVNTHRMLVRGHRVENPEERKTVYVTADAIQVEPVIVAPFVAVPMLLLLLIALLLPRRRRK